jgi:hypothetical protein
MCRNRQRDAVTTATPMPIRNTSMSTARDPSDLPGGAAIAAIGNA